MRRMLRLFLLLPLTLATAWAQEVVTEESVVTEETPEVIEETIPEGAIFKVTFVNGTDPIYYTTTKELYQYLVGGKSTSSPVTVTLLNNITTDGRYNDNDETPWLRITFGAHVIFDLNGNTWDSGWGYCLQNDGIMTICDSKGGGKLAAKPYAVISNSGFLEITGGTLEATSGADYVVKNDGTLLFRGGLFQSTDNVPLINSGSLEITGGTFDTPITNSATYRIRGGSFKAENVTLDATWLAAGCSLAEDAAKPGYSTVTVTDEDAFVREDNLGYLIEDNYHGWNMTHEVRKWTGAVEISGCTTYNTYYYFLLDTLETVKCNGTSTTPSTLQLNGFAAKTLEVSASMPLNILGPGKIEAIAGFHDGVIVRLVGQEEVTLPHGFSWVTNDNGEVILKDITLFNMTLADGTAMRFMTTADLNDYLNTSVPLSSPAIITLRKDITTSDADAQLTLTSATKAHILFDFNGHVWTTTRDKTIVNESAFLTLCNSQGSGGFKYDLSESASTPIYNAGILEITGGTYEPLSSETDATKMICNENGTLLIRGGTFADTSDGTNRNPIYNVGNGTLEIVGGTFDVPVSNIDSATCRVRGGAFETTSCVPTTELLAAGCTAVANDTGYSTVTVTNEDAYVQTDNLGLVRWHLDDSDGFSYMTTTWTESLEILDTPAHYVLLDNIVTIQCKGTAEMPSSLELNRCTVTTLEVSETLPLTIIGPGKIENITGYTPNINVTLVGAEAVELPHDYHWVTADNGEVILEDAIIFKMTLADGSVSNFVSTAELTAYFDTCSDLPSPVIVTVQKDFTTDTTDAQLTFFSNSRAHIIFDFKGHTWTTYRYDTIGINNAYVTIRDSQGGGGIKYHYSSNARLFHNLGTLEIEGGIFEPLPSATVRACLVENTNRGRALIRGGVFRGPSGSSIKNFDYSETYDPYFEIAGGTFDVPIESGGSWRIHGGSFKTEGCVPASEMLAAGCSIAVDATKPGYSTVTVGDGFVRENNLGSFVRIEYADWFTELWWADTLALSERSALYVLLDNVGTVQCDGSENYPPTLELNGYTVTTLEVSGYTPTTLIGPGKIENISGFHSRVTVKRSGIYEVKLPEGYSWKAADNGEFILEGPEENPYAFEVSFVDGTAPLYYADTASLAEYLWHGPSTSSPITVTLLKNIWTDTLRWGDEKLTVNDSNLMAHIIFDLNGKTWNASWSSCIENRGVLTICDSKGGGKISYSTGYDDVEIIENSGFLEITGGTFELTTWETNQDTVYVVENEEGTTLIRGGTFRSSSQKPVHNSTGHLEITGGTFDVPVSNNADSDSATCRITGGSFKTEDCVPAAELLAAGCSIAEDTTKPSYSTVTVTDETSFVQADNLGYLIEHIGMSAIKYEVYKWTESAEIAGINNYKSYHCYLFDSLKTIKCKGQSTLPVVLELNGHTVTTLDISDVTTVDIRGPGTVENIVGYREGVKLTWDGNGQITNPPHGYRWAEDDNGGLILVDADHFQVTVGDGTTSTFTSDLSLKAYLNSGALPSPVTITLMGDAVASDLQLNASLQAHVILDLNGYTWEALEGKCAIENIGTILTICDSKGGGKIWCEGTDTNAAPIYNYSILEIAGGTIETSSSKAYLYTVYNVGKLLIRDGIFADSSNGTNRKPIYNTKKSRLEIAGGTFDVPVSLEGTAQTEQICSIRGGSFETTHCTPSILATGCSISADATKPGYSTVLADESALDKTQLLGSASIRKVGDTYACYAHTQADAVVLDTMTNYLLLFEDLDGIQYTGETGAALNVNLNGHTLGSLTISSSPSEINIIGPGKVDQLVGCRPGVTVTWNGTGEITPPRGFHWVDNGNGSFTLAEADKFKVTLGDGTEKIYTSDYTLQNDLNAGALSSPVTITLMGDVVANDFQLTASVQAHVILDLNGYTWEALEGSYAIGNDSAILTICDSSEAGSGTIRHEGSSETSSVIFNTGFLEITGGTFEAALNNNQVVLLLNGGTALIRNGSFRNVNDNSISNFSNLEIAGGIFDVPVRNLFEGTSQIRGGSFDLVNSAPTITAMLATGCSFSASTTSGYVSVSADESALDGAALLGAASIREVVNSESGTISYVYDAYKWVDTLEISEGTACFYLVGHLARVKYTLETATLPTLNLRGYTVRKLEIPASASEISILGPGKIDQILGFHPGVIVEQIGQDAITPPRGYQWTTADNGDVILVEADNFNVTLGDGTSSTFTSDHALEDYLNAGALPSPVTITLMSDVVASDFQLNASVQAHVILDLNGYAWEAPDGKCAVENNSAILTIRDSQGGGKIWCEGTAANAAPIYNHGVLEITGGTFEASSFRTDLYTTYNTGTLLIRDGAFADASNGANRKPIYNTKNSHLEIAGGTFDVPVSLEGVAQTEQICSIRGGSFETTSCIPATLATGCTISADVTKPGYSTVVVDESALDKTQLLGAASIKKDGDAHSCHSHMRADTAVFDATTTYLHLFDDLAGVKYTGVAGATLDILLNGHTLGALDVSSAEINISAPGKIEKITGFLDGDIVTLVGQEAVELPESFRWKETSEGDLILEDLNTFRVTLGDGTEDNFTTLAELNEYFTTCYAPPSPVTITLLKNFEMSSTDTNLVFHNYTKTHIILDLNGKVWTTHYTALMNEGAFVTIRDSQGGGGFKYGTEGSAHKIYNRGIMEITGGTFGLQSSEIYTASRIFNHNGTILIRGGTFCGTALKNYADSSSAAYLEITGGTFDVPIENAATCRIRGGSFKTDVFTMTGDYASTATLLAAGCTATADSKTGYSTVTVTDKASYIRTENLGYLRRNDNNYGFAFTTHNWATSLELTDTPSHYILLDSLDTVKCDGTVTTPTILELNGHTVKTLEGSETLPLTIIGPGKIENIAGYNLNVEITLAGEEKVELPRGYSWNEVNGANVLGESDRFKVTLGDGTEENFTSDTLLEAFLNTGALPSPVTITLESDIFASDFQVNKSLMAHVILDLNGYTWEAPSGDCVIYNEGAFLTVCDSSEGKTGKIMYSGSVYEAAYIYNAGFLEITGGTFAAVANENPLYAICNYATMLIRDGTFQMQIQNGGHLEISGGRFDAFVGGQKKDTITGCIYGGSFKMMGDMDFITSISSMRATGCDLFLDETNEDYIIMSSGGYPLTKEELLCAVELDSEGTCTAYKWLESLKFLGVETFGLFLLDNVETLTWSGNAFLKPTTPPNFDLNGYSVGTLELSSYVPLTIIGPGKIEKITGYTPYFTVSLTGAPKTVELPRGYSWGEVGGRFVLEDADRFEVTFGDGTKKTFWGDCALQNYLAKALQSPVTITLLNDVVANDFLITQTVNARVILDLNGHTWEAPVGTCAIENKGATLTIRDSSASKTGKIWFEGSSTDAAAIKNHGLLEITGGTFEVSSAMDYSYTIYNDGTLCIQDGTFVDSSNGVKLKPIYSSNNTTLESTYGYMKEPHVEIAGGTFDVPISLAGTWGTDQAMCRIRGGSFKTANVTFSDGMLADGCSAVENADTGYSTVEVTGDNFGRGYNLGTWNWKYASTTLWLTRSGAQELDVEQGSYYTLLLDDIELLCCRIAKYLGLTYAVKIDLNGYSIKKLDLSTDILYGMTLNFIGPGEIQNIADLHDNVTITLTGAPESVKLPNGYRWKDDGNGGYVLEAMPIFKVTLGDGTETTYSSVARLNTFLESYPEVQSPVTITLLEDIETYHDDVAFPDPALTIEPTMQAHVILDLNGKTWRAHHYTAIHNRGVLTICDSDSQGRGTFLYHTNVKGYYDANAIVNAGGFMEITGGTFGGIDLPSDITSFNMVFNTRSGHNYYNDTYYHPGTLLIRGGRFLSGSMQSMIRNIVAYVSEIENPEEAYLEITGGTFDIPVENGVSNLKYAGICRIRGGSFKTKDCVPATGLLATGCTVSEDDRKPGYSTVQEGEGFVKEENLGSLSGWTQRATGYDGHGYTAQTHKWTDTLTIGAIPSYRLLLDDQDTLQGDITFNLVDKPTVELNGHTIKQLSLQPLSAFNLIGPGKIEKITGFSSGIPVKRLGGYEIELPFGYRWVESGDGNALLATAEAEVNGTRYETIEEAIAAAQEGDVVSLHKELTSKVNISEDVTINLNDFSFFPFVTNNATVTLVGSGELTGAAIAVSGTPTNENTVTTLGTIQSAEGAGSITLPANCEWVANRVVCNKVFINSPTNGKVVVGDLDSLAACVANYEEDGKKLTTVKLLGNLTDDWLSLEGTQRMSLDLNGCTLEIYRSITNHGLLRIYDGSGNGIIAGMNAEDPLIDSYGTFGLECGNLIAKKTVILSRAYGRLFVEGGSVISSEDGAAIDIQSSGGCEINGGVIYGNLAVSTASFRIRGGSFTVNPSTWLRGVYVATYNTQAGRWDVGRTDLATQTASTIQAVMSGDTDASALSTFGALSTTDDGTTLKMASPISVVQGSTIVLNGETVATIPASTMKTSTATNSMTEQEKAIEANKILNFLNAAYTVTLDGDHVVLSYDYDFNVEGMTVTAMASNDDTKDLHEVTFTLVLREGEELLPRTVTLDKAKLVIDCNEESISDSDEVLTFAAEKGLEYKLYVETDKQAEKANLFKVRLEQK